MVLSFPLHHWQSFMLTSPLTPSLFGSFNRSTFYLGFRLPYMVMLFLVFWYISFTSSFVHSIMPALYRTFGTTHVFVACNTCFAFNFNFNVDFNLFKHSFLMFFFHLFLTYISFLQTTKILIFFFSNRTNIFNNYSVAFKFFCTLHS